MRPLVLGSRAFNITYQLKVLEPKIESHTNFYEYCDLTKNYISTTYFSQLPPTIYPLATILIWSQNLRSFVCDTWGNGTRYWYEAVMIDEHLCGCSGEDKTYAYNYNIIYIQPTYIRVKKSLFLLSPSEKNDSFLGK